MGTHTGTEWNLWKRERRLQIIGSIGVVESGITRGFERGESRLNPEYYDMAPVRSRR